MAQSDGGILRTAGIAFGALVLLILLVVILGSIVAPFIVGAAGSVEWEPESEESEEIIDDDELPSGFSVEATTGYGVKFQGDGYVEGGVADGWDSGNWSVCSTQKLDEEANTQATRTVFAYDNETILLQYADEEWKGYYYDDSLSAETAINVSDPHEFESVCLGWNDEELELTLSNGIEEDSAYRDSNSPDRSVAHDWYGTIDETRILTEPPDESRTATYVSDPVDPLVSAQHEARWMFNEGEGLTTNVYYSDIDATIVNGEWVDGVDAPELDEGIDYEISLDPVEVTILSGGYLDGAPTAFAIWDGNPFATFGEGILGQIGAILTLLAIAIIVIVANVIMKEFGAGFGKR